MIGLAQRLFFSGLAASVASGLILNDILSAKIVFYAAVVLMLCALPFVVKSFSKGSLSHG